MLKLFELAKRPTPYLWLLSFCIVGLTFKQLKFTSFVGPMELLTIGFLLVGLFESLRQGAFFRIRILRPIAICFLVLSLGTLWALFADPSRLILRDVVAYIFTFFCLMIFLTMAYGREASAMRIVGIVIGLYLLASAVVGLAPSPVRPYFWYDEVKLQALSDNPNQIAFLAIVSLSLLTGSDMLRGSSDPWTVIASTGGALAGILTESGAFALAMPLVVIIPIATQLVRKRFLLWPKPVEATENTEVSWKKLAHSIGANDARIPSTVWVVAIATLIYSATLMYPVTLMHPVTFRDTVRQSDAAKPPQPQASQIAERFEKIMDGNSGQGRTRISLWLGALEVAKKSPIVGYGAGQHIPFEQEGKVYLYEAHNTALDLLVNSGLIGLASIAVCIFWIIRGALQTQSLHLVLTLLGPIGLFAMFHYTGRQPLFWIAIALVASMITARSSRRMRSNPVNSKSARIAIRVT